MVSPCGFLDPIDDGTVRGWAIGDDTLDQTGVVQVAVIDLLIDTQLVARLRADCYRGDLEARGIRSGLAAFTFDIPNVFRDGETHVLDLRYAGTEVSLRDAPVTFQLGTKGTTIRDKRVWCTRNLVYQAPPASRLAASLEETRKLVVVSTYHEATAHLVYHRLLFEGLSRAGFTVLVVHAAERHRHSLTDIDIPNCFTILKRNIGYDFGSYAVGLFAICDALPVIEEIIFMNDSILQIGGCLASLIARFRKTGADAVSCTDSFERHYHLQSYMIWFGTRICRSNFLPRFMADYSFTSIKEDVIDQGEIGLSRRLQAAGYVLAAVCDYQSVAGAWVRRYGETLEEVHALPGFMSEPGGPSFKKTLLERLDLLMNLVLTGTPLNPSHFFWDVLIEDFGLPFIKRELAIVNPCNVPTYFKLGTFFSSGSESLAALLEIRRLYGGHLIPPAIPHRQLPRSERSPAGWRKARKDEEPISGIVDPFETEGARPLTADILS